MRQKATYLKEKSCWLELYRKTSRSEWIERDRQFFASLGLKEQNPSQLEDCFEWNLPRSVEPSEAKSLYPNPLSLRPEGSDQAKTGSCLAHAMIASIEHVYERENRPVKLSPFYTHYSVELDRGRKWDTPLSPADTPWLQSIGPLLPSYIVPQRYEGHLTETKTTRPQLVDYSDLPEEWKNHSRFGFKQEVFTFNEKSSHSVTIMQVKEMIDQNKAVVSGIYSAILSRSFVDPSTGYFRAFGFTTEQVKEKMLEAEKIDPDRRGLHGVALIGYDDEHESFIVKNSWVNENRLSLALDELSYEKQQQWKRFRGRIQGGVNLPGYFLIPYEYFAKAHLLKGEEMPLFVYSWERDQFYQMYEEWEDRYEVVSLPYACDGESTQLIARRSNVNRFLDIFEKFVNGKSVSRFKSIFSGAMTTQKKFAIEQFSYRKDVNSNQQGVGIRNFWNGKLDSYYCSPGGAVWPRFQFEEESWKRWGRDLFEGSSSAWIEFFNQILRQEEGK